MEIFMKHGELYFDASSLVAWAFKNCELKIDSHGNCKPVKANGATANKIDPVIASIEALSAYLFEQLLGDMKIFSLQG